MGEQRSLFDEAASARTAPAAGLLDRSAVLSHCGTYRYSLTRRWPGGAGVCVWIMLNPSTADHTVDDPTIRRCIGFSQAWGFKSLEVVNLFGLRSTDPAALRKAADPIGPDNDEHLLLAAAHAARIVVAWGNHGALLGRGARVIELLGSRQRFCFRLTKQGHPEHPLYQKNASELIEV